jgi:hypothetical protein
MFFDAGVAGIHMKMKLHQALLSAQPTCQERFDDILHIQPALRSIACK